MNKKMIKRLVVTAGVATLALSGVGIGAMAQSQSTSSVSALNQTAETKLATTKSTEFPTKILTNTSAKLSVEVSGDKDNFTVKYVKDGTTVLTYSKETHSSTSAAKDDAAPTNDGTTGQQVGLTTKTDAYQQGVMGQTKVTWDKGNWQVSVSTVNASGKDPQTTSKGIVSALAGKTLPTTSGQASLDLVIGKDGSDYTNQATWSDSTASYTLTATDSTTLLNALTSMK